MPTAADAGGGSSHSAQLEELTTSIHKGMAQTRATTAKLREPDISWWGVFDAIEPIDEGVQALVVAAEELLKTVEKLVKSIVAPVRVGLMSFEWSDKVQGPATGVAANTRWQELSALDHWEGRAADQYRRKTTGQPTAADRIGAIASAVSEQLMMAAGAGLVFYAAVAACVVKMLKTLELAVNAIRSGAGVLLGIAIGLAELRITKTQLGLIGTAFTAYMVDQGKNMLGLIDPTNDWGQFPGHEWPTGVLEA